MAHADVNVKIVPGHKHFVRGLAESLFGANLTVTQVSIVADVIRERVRQVTKWGPQRHPDLHWDPNAARLKRNEYVVLAHKFKALNDRRHAKGQPGVWADILLEELYEALESDNQADLDKELVETIAVATAWLEDLRTRGGELDTPEVAQA